MTLSDDVNPYAVTTLETAAPPQIQFGEPSKALLWLHRVAIALLVVGTIFAQIDIESIVASGPIMLLWGLAMAWFLRRPGAKCFIWFWGVCVTFPFVVFSIIYFKELSPQQAQLPIGILVGVVAAGCICGLVVSLTKYRHSFSVNDS